MMEPMMWLAFAGAAFGAAGVVHSAWDLVQHLRAEREFVRVLAESDEFRPLILQLRARDEREGGLDVGEHEAIDLRNRVRQALDYLPRRDRKRVEACLYSRTVRGREFYLYKVLYASMQRLQHQS